MSGKILKSASGNKGKAAYRGRSYQCRRCLKVDRKGRTVAHILKHHVPFDQVPYSCSLCSFRCLDKDTLVSHINQYKRHREEVRKAGGKVDHSKVLHRSSNPKIIGNDDMVLLTREDSGKRFTRQEDPLNQDDHDSIFEDDEDDCDALSLPAWAKGDTPSSPLDVLYRATPLTTSGATVSYQDQFPAFSGTHLVQQTLPHSSAWAMTTATTETVTNPVIHSSIHQVLTTPPHPLFMNQASPWVMVTTATSTRPTVISHTVDTRQQFVPQSSSFQHPTIPTCTTINLQDLYPQNETKSSTLGQFRVNKIFNTGQVNQPTPLMDEPERESPAFEDILPSLMHAASESDPLMLEIQTEKSRTSEKRGSEVQEGESKKMKGEDQIPHSCPPVDLSPIVKAIDRATKEIVDAIDRGSRALRCHDQSLLKVVSSLGRIERVLEKRRESGRSPSREVRRDRDRETDKENSKPVLKSTVNKVNSNRK